MVVPLQDTDIIHPEVKLDPANEIESKNP